MKKSWIAFLSLVAINSYANEAQPVYYAELNCDVYTTRIEDRKIKESKWLAATQGKRFELGMAQWLKVELPEPYTGIKVGFNHFTTHYNEIEHDASMPYLEAFFIHNQASIDKTRINFDIKNPEEGSKIFLRGTYKVNPEAFLSYRCYLTFVK